MTEKKFHSGSHSASKFLDGSFSKRRQFDQEMKFSFTVFSRSFEEFGKPKPLITNLLIALERFHKSANF